jgi:hypothetical protein
MWRENRESRVAFRSFLHFPPSFSYTIRVLIHSFVLAGRKGKDDVTEFRKTVSDSGAVDADGILLP